jgi:hypothetical protein
MNCRCVSPAQAESRWARINWPLVLDDAQRPLRASADCVARPPEQIGFVVAYRAKDFSPAHVIARLKYFGSGKIALSMTDTDFEIHFDFYDCPPRRPPYPMPPAAWSSDNLSSKGLKFFRKFAFLFQIHALDCLRIKLATLRSHDLFWG